MQRQKQPPFLPVSQKELDKLGINRPDIILVSGDAYVDHPSFASAILGRVLWDAGFSVAVLPQPDTGNSDSFHQFPPPKLFFSVSAGSMDSMVCHYTAAKKRRKTDAYSPGGRLLRPDRTTLVYTDLIHREFPDTPIIIGGIEASLRRFAHYDYWSDRIRQSLLADAPANLLVFGMGERPLCEIATRLSAGEPAAGLRDIRGTVWKAPVREAGTISDGETITIPSFEEVRDDPLAFAHAWEGIVSGQNPVCGRKILQKHPKTLIIQNPPARPLTSREMDTIYELPYRRAAHPSYREPVPALEPVRFSVISHRGCYGNCSFCALAMHQTGIIQSRSRESILREIEQISRMKKFPGIITDIGGPSANMFGDTCPQWETSGPCPDRDCITCGSIRSGINDYLDLLDAAEMIPGVRHVFIGSGIRYDLLPPDPEIIRRVCRHVSGHLKVAPEHVSDRVLSLMHKPGHKVFKAFRAAFEGVQRDKASRQYLVPYLISGHPGCEITDMIELAEYLQETGIYPEQVQDFTPTPMTASTCMYVTGRDPTTGQSVHVPKDAEKQIQRAVLHWKDEKNYDYIRRGLKSAGREDLIGYGPHYLVPPKRGDRKSPPDRYPVTDRRHRRDP